MLDFFLACSNEHNSKTHNYVEVSKHFFEQVNIFNEQQGFREVNINYKTIKIDASYKDPEQGETHIAWADNAALFINAKVVPFAYLNSKVENGKELQTAPDATWSKEKAIEMVGFFIRRALPQIEPELQIKSADYEKVLWASGISKWNIEYARVNPEGREYLEDRLSIDISELKGIQAFRVRFFSEPKRFGKPQIIQEKALELALAERKAMLEWPPVRDAFAEHRVEIRPSQVELKIVNANYLRGSDDLEDAFSRDVQGNAKLAWCVRFEAFDKNAAPNQPSLLPMLLEVWVDAITGEIVGGRF
jgi:hypothetical protein